MKKTNLFKAASKSPYFHPILMGLFLCFYLTLGFYTELHFIHSKPIPNSLLQDFKYYERALFDALNGDSPYTVRAIGPGYLYPPPALLIVEIFSYIKSFSLKVAVFSVLNIMLLMLMTYGVAKYYGYRNNQIWYWYPIGLAFAPFLELLHIGQINMLTLFGIFLLFLWTENSHFLGGAGLAFAIITKVSPILFFPYLVLSKKWKTIIVAFTVIMLLIGISILRYGYNPVTEYPSVLQWLANQFSLGSNPQSFVAKLIGLQEILEDINIQVSLLVILANYYQLVQHFITLYVLLIITISGVFFFLGKQEREPLFIITSLGMMLSPNVMWYHHYVFILLPILIWMGWSRLERKIVLWCLIGLIIIQIDRHIPPYGLLIHIFGHISIIIILFEQIKTFFNRNI